jgi:nucleoside 2-deoxyribosyltransferase
MKTYFLAYRFSGESADVLNERLSLTVESLKQAGIDAYCNFFDNHVMDSKTLSKRQIIDKAFKKIDESDGLFVLIASNDKSEGQLFEVGYSIAKGKKIIAAVQENVTTYVSDLADEVIIWSDLSDLGTKLKGLSI